MSNPSTQATLDRAQRLHLAGQFREAEAVYREMLALDPADATSRHLLGLLLYQQGRQAEGIELVSQTVQRFPDHAVFRFNFGSVLIESDPAAATEEFRRALALQPDYPDAMANLAVALCKQSKFEDAVVVSRLVLAQRPQSPATMFNLAQALRGQGEVAFSQQKYAEAADFFRQATSVNARNFDAHFGLAEALAAQSDPEAGDAYRQALSVKPDSFEGCIGLARWLDHHQHAEEARETYRRAIALRPDAMDAQSDLAALYGRAGFPDQAIAASQQILAVHPGHVHAAATLGAALSQTGKNEEAAKVLLEALERSKAADPLSPAMGEITSTDRTMLAGLLSNLFLLRHYEESYDPEKLFREQLTFGRIVDRQDPAQRFDLAPRETLRIGYVSGDFRRHAVASFIEPILANHDAGAFDIFCYSNTEVRDEITARLQGYAHHWKDIDNLPDDDVVKVIENDRIDILVDLSGHTGGNRLPVFGRKPAPVQVTYLGFPNSTGLPTMDYRISDSFADPVGLTERYHQEKIVRLPHGFYCYRPHDDAPAVTPSPANETGNVTFASLNVFRKISPMMMRLWARVLSKVPNSRLMMITHAGADGSVRAMFNEAGVSSDRLELVQRGRLVEYYERLARADIQLDTHPYSGHTTTCDCLWMGVPVITLAGNTSVSRSGVSVLSNIGHAELIANTAEKYVEIATRLANDLPRLGDLRQRLREDMARSPITNAKQITRDIEAAYQTMWRKKLAEASR